MQDLKFALCALFASLQFIILKEVHINSNNSKNKFFYVNDRGNHAKALEIVRDELKVFASHDEKLVKEITQLLTFDDFR